MSIIGEPEVRRQMGALTTYVDTSLRDNASKLIADSIAASEDEWETDTRLLLSPKTVVMLPQAGDEFDIEEPAINFHRAGRNIMPRFRVRFLPIRTIERVAFQLAANQTIIEYPMDWVKPDLRLGIINLIPYKLAVPAFGSAAMTWVNMFAAGVMGSDGWPHLIVCNYTAGYDQAAQQSAVWPMPAQLKFNLAKDAAWRVVGACRRDLPNSVTLDGFSQQFMSTDKYLKDLHDEFMAFQSEYVRKQRPMNMGIL